MPDKTLNPDLNLHDAADWEALARYLAGESPPGSRWLLGDLTFPYLVERLAVDAQRGGGAYFEALQSYFDAA